MSALAIALQLRGFDNFLRGPAQTGVGSFDCLLEAADAIEELLEALTQIERRTQGLPDDTLEAAVSDKAFANTIACAAILKARGEQS